MSKRDLVFSPQVFEDLAWWIENDRKEYRLVYKMEKDKIKVLSCRFHYKR